jgi:sialate O-acetylesterase
MNKLKRWNKILLTAILSLSGYVLSAEIVLPSVFCDNMVLQQNSEVAIWGWGNAGEQISIVAGWNTSDTIKVKTDNTARWETKLITHSAGGPYVLQIFGSSNIELQNVMLGEVWICSGQSNMEWSVNMGISNGEEEAAQADYPDIRIFQIPKIGADFPQQDCNATWEVCSPQTMRKTSAVGYFFARELNQKLNVPVGIIVSAWGGTPAEVWIEKNRIEENADLNNNRYALNYDWWPSEPGVLYNSMIHPIVPFGVAGALWYQGESNVSNHQIYSLLLKTLIESWREDFNKQFPFYYVQIALIIMAKTGNLNMFANNRQWLKKLFPLQEWL